MPRSKRSDGESVGSGASQRGAAGAGPPSSLSFEAALSSLEGVVSRLESGDMPLEQALEAFEAGVKLSRQCAATLDAAERRIEILMAERGGLRSEPFAHGLRDADGDGDERADGAEDGHEIDGGDEGPDGEGRER